MEWFFEWWDKLVQAIFMKNMLGNFEWIDWVSLLFVFLGLIYGIKNGLMAEIAEIIELMIVIFLVLINYQNVARFIAINFHDLPEKSVKSLAYILTGALIWTIMILISQMLKKFVHTSMTAPLRIFGGGLLGMVHFFLALSFVSQAYLLMPFNAGKKVFSEGNSYSGYYLAQLAPRVVGMVSEPSALLETSSEAGKKKPSQNQN